MPPPKKKKIVMRKEYRKVSTDELEEEVRLIEMQKSKSSFSNLSYMAMMPVNREHHMLLRWLLNCSRASFLVLVCANWRDNIFLSILKISLHVRASVIRSKIIEISDSDEYKRKEDTVRDKISTINMLMLIRCVITATEGFMYDELMNLKTVVRVLLSLIVFCILLEILCPNEESNHEVEYAQVFGLSRVYYVHLTCHATRTLLFFSIGVILMMIKDASCLLLVFPILIGIWLSFSLLICRRKFKEYTDENKIWFLNSSLICMYVAVNCLEVLNDEEVIDGIFTWMGVHFEEN
jgi:hypothetical protein